MKKITCALVLVLSIKGVVFAQTFEFPDKKFHTRFQIDLGKENKIGLDLKEHDDLNRLPDIDSLLRVFIQDMIPFKDSLSDDLTIKKIDYKIDSTGRKEIRIQQFRPAGSSYVVDKGNLAALKLEQDTVYILSGFYRVTVFINRLSGLAALLNGTIDDKIRTLRFSHDDNDWVRDKKGERVHLRTDPAISAAEPFGGRIQPSDMLEIYGSVSIQNYKTYFVPSFNLGAKVVYNNSEWKKHNSRFKYEIGAYWEPQFLFRSTPSGLNTYRNDFITVSFGYGLKDPSVKDKSPILNSFSLGYLVGNRGAFYAPHTFRVGIDELVLFKDKTMIEPLIYFNNLFNGVTPGLRITQVF